MLAIQPTTEIQTVEANGLRGFVALEPEWNALVEATTHSPFLRHEFIRVWIDSFAPGAKLVVLTGRDATGRLVAALPLMEERGFVCGLPARQLVSTANTHSCRFDLIAEDPGSAAPAFFAHLLARPGWDLLRLIDVPEGGGAWQLQRYAGERGCAVGVWESQRSPYLAFPSSHEELLAGMSTQFRANLRRRRRQLERMGSLTFERVTGGPRLQELLEEGFALEESGWKGQEGTAIRQDRKTHAYYSELARSAAERGHLSLFLLRIDGRLVAFHYGLTYGGIYYVPKLAYDESLTACSPGLVLLEEAIKDGISRGLRGYDFLGGDAEWKTRWTDTALSHSWLFIFRNTSFGRALRKAKFELVPAAKQALRGLERRQATVERRKGQDDE